MLEQTQGNTFISLLKESEESDKEICSVRSEGPEHVNSVPVELGCVTNLEAPRNCTAEFLWRLPDVAMVKYQLHLQPLFPSLEMWDGAGLTIPAALVTQEFTGVSGALHQEQWAEPNRCFLLFHNAGW